MTSLEQISRAMRLLGVLAAGEVPSNSEAQDGLTALNSMLHSWTKERLMIFSITDATFSLVTTQQTYQIGIGAADFNVARPVKIESARTKIAAGGNYLYAPMRIISQSEWSGIENKGASGVVASVLYNDNAFPYANLNLWPTPTFTGTALLELFTWTILSDYPDLTTDVAFPYGFDEAISYNLAIRLAPEFGAVLRQDVIDVAARSRAVLQQANTLVEAATNPSLPVAVAAQGPSPNEPGQQSSALNVRNG